MLTGGEHLPYRLPAGGARPNYFLRPRHGRSGDKPVEIYAPAVSVPVYDSMGRAPNDPDYVATNGLPYEVFNQAPISEETCSPVPPESPAVPVGWIGGGDYQFTMVPSQLNTAPTQTYTNTDTKLPTLICNKQGFKTVAAKRNWHGIFGFMSHDGNECVDTYCPETDSWYESYQATPDQTKYLSLSFSFSATLSYNQTSWIKNSLGEYTAGPSTVTGGGGVSLEFSLSVDPESGETTLSGYAFSTSIYTQNADSTYSYPSASSGYGGFFNSFAVSAYPFDYLSSLPCGGVVTIGGFTGYPGDFATYIADYVADLTSYGSFDEPYSWTSSGASASVSNTSFTFGVTQSANNVYDFTDTGGVEEYDNISITYTAALSITLSSPNTAGDLQSDAAGLLAEWNLSDDHIYPWRQDGSPQVAPLVARNETGAQVPWGVVSAIGIIDPSTDLYTSTTLFPVNDLSHPIDDSSGNAPFTMDWSPTYDQISWFDSAVFLWIFSVGHGADDSAALGLVQIYDGAVLGAPNPVGHNNYFMWDFVDWRSCTDPDTGDPIWSQYGWGMWLEDYNSQVGVQLPLTATRWTNNLQVIVMKPGPQIQFGIPGTDGGLWVYKYATTLPLWQSTNFGRPAGADRFVYDEANVFCVASNVAGVVTLNNLDGSTPSSLPFVAGTDIVGGASVGGFYAVAAVAANVVTLGALKYAVPTDWASPSDDGDTCFGRLLWNNAPGILGRALIAATDNGDGTLNLAGTSAFIYSATGDKVNLYNSVMTSKGSNLTLTKIDDSTAKVTATFDASIIYVTPYLLNDGVTDGGKFYFFDNYPKGDSIALEWTLDNRTNGEYGRIGGATDCDGSPYAPAPNNGYASFSQTQVSLPPNECNPSVVFWTTEDGPEDFPNSQKFTIPSPELDATYGTVWAGFAQMFMTDPFWQYPHNPCDLGYGQGWGSDDGTCQVSDDTKRYFALPPQVEPLIAVPTNFGAGQDEIAPSLAAGASPLGWLSPVDHTTGDVSYISAAVGFDPGTGFPKGVSSGVNLKITLVAAVDPESTCVFMVDYDQWVIPC